MIPIELPMDINTTLKRFETVEVMLTAATAASPRTEYRWFITETPADHKASFASRGVPLKTMSFVSANTKTDTRP